MVVQVLSHKDFKGLLKWRQKMREFAQLGKFAEKEEEVEEVRVVVNSAR